ncbi:hypothetical protein [Ferrovibrio sp.]|uniref:hypothetical protein n=1 Tax=Ferrovibrio sp. TaxID=1917215 RepID=UPI0035B112B0
MAKQRDKTKRLFEQKMIARFGGNSDQAARFCDVAYSKIIEFWEAKKSNEETIIGDRDIEITRLTKFFTVTKDFVKASHAILLHDLPLDRIEAAALVLHRKSGLSLSGDQALAKASQDIKVLRAAIPVLQRLLPAIDDACKTAKLRRKVLLEDLLIKNLSQAYATAAAEQPSSAREGRFCLICNELYNHFDLGDPPGERKLRTILSSMNFGSIEKPKRGRKRNSSK